MLNSLCSKGRSSGPFTVFCDLDFLLNVTPSKADESTDLKGFVVMKHFENKKLNFGQKTVNLTTIS